MSLFDTILKTIPPIHKEGYRFIAIFAAITLFFYWLHVPFLPTLGVVLTLWCAYFFRDPVRTTPVGENLVISPADGRISAIERVTPPAELDLDEIEYTRISVFMNVFDVHVNRVPVAGRIIKLKYIPGLFVNAELDKASEDNERQALTIESKLGVKYGVVQIAGLIARRIVKFVDEGDSVEAGFRFGLIRFGSRVDVYLPTDVAVRVCVGQRAVAGETIFADLTVTGEAMKGRAA